MTSRIELNKEKQKNIDKEKQNEKMKKIVKRIVLAIIIIFLVAFLSILYVIKIGTTSLIVNEEVITNSKITDDLNAVSYTHLSYF